MPNADLRDEMKAVAEPLLPVEKKLIGWSIGLALRAVGLAQSHSAAQLGGKQKRTER